MLGRPVPAPALPDKSRPLEGSTPCRQFGIYNKKVCAVWAEYMPEVMDGNHQN